ncbi:ABC transporter substrate-binding protein [candidate division KSB1 bacterium]|nr:ABC transporter substrate-binding protein [bacterium]NUM68122.1 ABC transporter substrate-binding protein [candidate division KSB1 bacterium]
MNCSRDKDQTENKTIITFWHSFVASTIPSLEELIKKFEAEHPGIKIKAQYVPTGDALVQKLITAIQSQTAPDISWIHADFLDKLVEARAVYRLEEFVKGPNGLTNEEINDIFAPLLQAASWRDTLYAMPMEATSLALLYNKELFRQAGLDPNHPPQNWEELREFAQKLTIDKNGDGKFDQHGFLVPVFPASGDLNIWMILQWTPFLWQAGGYEINLEQTAVLFNSEAGVQALTLWKNMYDELGMRKFSMAHDMAFASQHLAMVLDGPWNLPRYREMKNVDWAVAPLPAGPAKRATYLAGEHLAIFRQSRHPQAAWTFVKWILQPETQAMFSMKSGYLPVRRSVREREDYQNFLANDPALKAFVDQMEWGQARRPVDFHRLEINRHLAEAIEQATLGKMDPKAALDEAAAKANRLLQSAAKKQLN